MCTWETARSDSATRTLRTGSTDGANFAGETNRANRSSVTFGTFDTLGTNVARCTLGTNVSWSAGKSSWAGETSWAVRPGRATVTRVARCAVLAVLAVGSD